MVLYHKKLNNFSNVFSIHRKEGGRRTQFAIKATAVTIPQAVSKKIFKIDKIIILLRISLLADRPRGIVRLVNFKKLCHSQNNVFEELY